MWEWLLPVIKTAITNISVESVRDWGTCFATSSVCIVHKIFESIWTVPSSISCDSDHDLSKPSSELFLTAMEMNFLKSPSLVINLNFYEQLKDSNTVYPSPMLQFMSITPKIFDIAVLHCTPFGCVVNE